MTYYDVLGVPPNATIDQIKKAYRRLVVRYHPDKTPDIHAVEVFRSVTEAYDVLSDPERKLAYDHSLNNADVTEEPATEEPPPHRDPAYRPRYTRRATSPKNQQVPSLRQLMASYLPYTEIISIGCLVVATIMIAEYLLPSRRSTERVAFIEVHSGHRYKWTKFVTDKGKSFVLDRSSHTGGFDIGDTVLIAKSIFLGIPRAVGSDQKMVRLGTGIYGNFIYLPVILLIISGFGVLTRKNVSWGYNFGVGSLLLLIFIAILLMIF